MIKKATKMMLKVFKTTIKHCEQIISSAIFITGSSLLAQHFVPNSFVHPVKSLSPLRSIHYDGYLWFVFTHFKSSYQSADETSFRS